jgi:putative inorganic carbon (HCO3(-)) transporter
MRPRIGGQPRRGCTKLPRVARTRPDRWLIPLLFVVLVAAALATLAIVESVRSEDDVLELAEVTPAFSPGGRGELPGRATIRFRLNESEPRATVEVTRRDESVVRTLSEEAQVAEGALNRYAWDGRTDSGRVAPRGLYSVRVTLDQLDRAPYLTERTRLAGAGSERSTSPSIEPADAGGKPVESSVGQWIALVVASGAVAFALLAGPGGGRGRVRARNAALGLALALALVLVVEHARGARVDALADEPALLVLAAIAAAALVVGLGLILARRPAILAPLAVAALPFRVPVEIGGQTSKVLIPLYVVIAAGLVGSAVRGAPEPPRSSWTRWLRWALAALVLLYALQSGYSNDFSQAVENACLFYLPFAALFLLLAELRWTSGMLIAVGVVVVAEALVLAAVGVVEASVRELLWVNPSVEAGNQVHPFFRVNSLMWDPNILGRYLALAAIALGGALLWTRSRRLALASVALALAVLIGLTLTFSVSSALMLIAGLAVLAAARWRSQWAIAIWAGLAVATVAVLLIGGEEGAEAESLNEQTSGRRELVRGGLELAGERPVAGYGSGSFEYEFGSAFGSAYDEPYAGPGTGRPLVASHTEPVTVAAEQGVVGLVAFGASVLLGLVVLILGLGPGKDRAAHSPQSARSGLRAGVAAAILAGFVAVALHSLLQGSLLSDPVTWTMLAIGVGITPEEGT